MRRAVLSLIFTIAAVPVTAQQRQIGGEIPLANAHSIPATGSPRLVASGGKLVLFWSTNQKIYAAPLDRGRPRAGRLVFGPRPTLAFDVAPIGDKFLVAGQMWPPSGATSISGQIVNGNGDPEGVPFELTNSGTMPHIAAGNGSLLLLYRELWSNDLKSIGLSHEGRPLSPARTLAPTNRDSGGGVYDTASVARGNTVFGAFVPDATGARAILYDDRGLILTERSITPTAKYTALASNGRQFLAVWTEADRVRAVTVGEDGVVGTPITIAQRGFSTACCEPQYTSFFDVSAIWSGTAWIVGFTELLYRNGYATDTRVVFLNEDATQIIGRDTTPDASKASIATATGSPVIVAWCRDEFEPIQTKLLAFDQDVKAVSALEPALNRVLAATSSADKTLFVFDRLFTDRGPVRAGIRDRDGRWREHEIFSIDRSLNLVLRAVAASDGRGFLVAIKTLYETWLLRLDHDGRRIGEPRRIDYFDPSGIAWNGRVYALSGRYTNEVAAALLVDPYSHPMRQLTIGGQAMASAVASDGESFYGLWIIQGRLQGMHIPNTFDRTESPLDLGPIPEHSKPFVLWTGKHYVAVWAADSAVDAARISATGKLLTRIAIANWSHPWGVSAARAGNSTAIMWVEPLFTRDARYIAFLGDDDAVLRARQEIDRFGFLTALLDGAVALTFPGEFLGIFEHDAPTRVSIRIASVALPALPDAPRPMWSADGDRYTIEWDAVPQQVTGYRVEYRGHGEPWREVAAWYGPDELSATITLPREGAPYGFRVRAINDRGMSAYGVANARLTRRRVAN